MIVFLLFTWLTSHSSFFTLCWKKICQKDSMRCMYLCVGLFGPWSLCDVFYYNSIPLYFIHTRKHTNTRFFLFRVRWYVLKVINQICSQQRQWVTQLVWNERNDLHSHPKRRLSIRSTRIVNNKKTNKQT